MSDVAPAVRLHDVFQADKTLPLAVSVTRPHKGPLSLNPIEQESAELVDWKEDLLKELLVTDAIS